MSEMPAAGRPQLADVRGFAEHCSYCPKMCRFACPVAAASGREAHNPWGIDRAVVALADDAVGATERAGVVAAVYACTGCRRCRTACLPDLDLPTHVRAARAAVVAAGDAPAGLEQAAGTPRVAGDALAAGHTAGADLLVWPSCHDTAVDDDALAALLSAAGRVWQVPARPACCGARSVDVGLAETGAERAEQALELVPSGARIVASDPHCWRWLRDDLGVDAISVAELLDELAGDLPLAAGGDAVAVHDACWLARQNRVTDAPRRLLARATGAEAIEPWPAPDHAGCSGGGMGLPVTHPQPAAAMAAGCAADVAATSAAGVVTGCPTAAARMAEAGAPATTLVRFLAGRLAAGGPATH